MELIDYLRFPVALLFVLALIALLALLARKYGLLGAGMAIKKKGGARLEIVEVKPLGPRNRLILVSHDEQEHLILMGPNGDLLIHSGPKPAQDNPNFLADRESE